jgi:alpha-glucosidase
VKPHFPWLFGADAENVIRAALELRYRLVPMLYSLGYETHETGMPLIRPLALYYGNDPKCADLTSEWLIGRDLLAAPVLSEDGRRTIYLPDDTWYDFASGEKVTGPLEIDRQVPLHEVPVYVRAGAIVPMAEVVQHTRDLPGGPLEAQVYPGRDGEFTLVEDDGATNAYLTGAVRRTTFKWNDAKNELSWTRSGAYNGKDCFAEVVVVRVAGHQRGFTEAQELSSSGRIRIEP